MWYNTLCNFFEGLGFRPVKADFSVFIKDDIIVAVYVDDLLIAGKSMSHIQELKGHLGKRFKMTDLGPCQHYLGMKVTRDRKNRILWLDQETYTEKVLKDFDMWDSAPKDTPMVVGTKLIPARKDSPIDVKSRALYQSAVGSLMYAMLGTRPDIAFPVSVISRFSANPTKSHWEAVKRIFRYLKGTIKYRLTFRGDVQPLTGFTDSDWGGDPDTRRSTDGYVFNVGSGAISWSSKRQDAVALSSTEAEYVGHTHATAEAIWLRRLLDEMDPLKASRPNSNSPQPVTIFADNQGAIALTKNPQFHGRTKHIEIKEHFCREKQASGEVKFEYIPTDLQTADILTKALPAPKFRELRRELGLEGPTDND